MMHPFIRAAALAGVIGLLPGLPATAQEAPPSGSAGSMPASVAVPEDYVIGPEDVLAVVFWREAEMSVGDVVVRPDGRISLPLLNDVPAAGLTPEQLAAALEQAAAKFVTNPNATVIVRQINSRRVHVIGEVARPGIIPLTSSMNMLQLVAAVGGFLEHAKRNDVVILRQENGRERRFSFHYNDVVRGRRPEQNILLKPGDIVVVR